jgi:hypothetical protein
MANVRRASALLLSGAVVGLLWPTTARAQNGAQGGTGEVVVLLVLVGAAYLLTHFVVGRLQKTLLVVAGVEYIVLGVLLGPVVPQIHALDDLAALLPIIALAAGWMGLVRGMELDLGRLREAGAGSVRLALGDDVVAGLLTAAGAYALFASGILGEVPAEEAELCAAVLGCLAATGSTDPIDVVRQRYEVNGDTLPILRRSVHLGDAIALFVFGLLFCIYHQSETAASSVLSPTEWAVVAILIGGVMGLVFRYFVGPGGSENARFLTLVGIITFASGAAWFLSLSPLLINLVLGFVLVNTAPAGEGLRETLERTEKPMSLVLLVFAGALWEPPLPLVIAFDRLVDGTDTWWTFASAVAWWIVVPLALFSALRLVGKIVGSKLAAWGRNDRSDLWRGLLSHGHVTVAMAISFRLVYDGLIVDVTYTVIVLAVVLHDLVAPRFLRGLLVDAGDLRKETAS